MKAFPNHRSEGMDLRDYFAAQAMLGYLSNPHLAKEIPMDRIEMSVASYALADAMMKAREPE